MPRSGTPFEQVETARNAVNRVRAAHDHVQKLDEMPMGAPLDMSELHRRTCDVKARTDCDSADRLVK